MRKLYKINFLKFFIAISVLLIFGIINNMNIANAASAPFTMEPGGSGLVRDEEDNKIYRVKVDNNITSVKFNATNANDKITVSGNDNLQVGTNKVTVKVTSSSGTTNYTVYVRRADTPISGETIVPNLEPEENYDDSSEKENENKNTNSEIENNVENEEIINEVTEVNSDLTNSANLVTNIITADNTNKNEGNNKTSILCIVIVIVILIIAMILKNKNRKNKRK